MVTATCPQAGCGTWFAYRLTFTGGPLSPGNILDFPTFGQDSRALLVGLSQGVCNLLTAVPNLTGLDQGTAESRITGAGLAIGNENPDFRCLERQGIVVSQTPAAGSSVMRGTPVNINVSTGTKANGNPCIFK